MVRTPSAGFVRLLAIFFLALTAHSTLAATGFSPQRRLGFPTGDQWEPAIAADSHGHIYVLFPQYGAVADCPRCTSPTISLLVSDDNGATWQAPRALSASPTGQFDPQILVDPVDKQTLYASWLQNNKRDVMVARSQDFGRSWYFTVAEHSPDDADKPVLTVHGPDIYVGFNHDEDFTVAASHDYAQNFSSTKLNPNAAPGWSLAGGATVDPAGEVYFSWTAYSRQSTDRTLGQTRNLPIALNVSRSTDGGRNWNTVGVDTSSAPPACAEEECEAGYLGPQIALTSDAAGTLYALWNAGSANAGPERIYFSSSTTQGASWSAKADVSSAGDKVEHCFPTLVAAASGDVRIAWMAAAGAATGNDPRRRAQPDRPLWNVFQRNSSNGGATWTPEARLSGPARGYDYITPDGFLFPFGDFFSIAIDNLGATHVVWGEGRNFKSPGSIWYAHGR